MVQNSQALRSSYAWNSVGAPCVIWDETDNQYKMWYTRIKSTLTKTSLQTILTGIANPATRKDAIRDFLRSTSTVIGYATSANGNTWTKVNSEVLVGNSTNVFDSVGAPCVIKDEADPDVNKRYKMWYTRPRTDLTRDDLDDILAGIADIDGFGIDGLLDILDGTGTVIGYATSNNGVTWAVQNSQHLVGNNITPWSGVAAPSVVRTGSRYEMWYTEGIGDLGLSNLWGLVSGDANT